MKIRTLQHQQVYIKQIALGRLVSAPSYLMSGMYYNQSGTRQNPVKVASYGDKVTPYTAQLRYAVPGVTLISPPHHDIYSIEDLAQLIFRFKTD